MEEFTVGFRRNREFDLPVALYFTIEGVGVSTFVVAAIMGFAVGQLIGLFLTFTGAGILLLDLGQPLRFWRAIRKAGNAWISRGSLLIGTLLVLGSLYTFYPDSQGFEGAEFLLWFLVVIGFLAVLYTGFLVSSMSAIPFWNSSLIPLLFLVHSAASGMSLVLALLYFTGYQTENLRQLAVFVIAVLILALVLTLIHLMTTARKKQSAQESVRLLLRGELNKLFVGGALVVGLLLPTLILLAVYSSFASLMTFLPWILASLLILRAAGEISYRFSILRAGVYEPVF